MKVCVNYNDKRWKKYNINFAKIANMVVGKKYKDAEVSITLVDDAEIHALNKIYRNMDKPTNVLSFELGDDILLGDIYISLDTVMREAKDAKISVEEHVAHMVVHGMFHLLGYDHLTDAQAKVMEAKEIAVLKKLGIKNPYQDDVKFSWWKYALCALFGGVASLGFAPFNMWLITVLAVAGAYWILCAGNEKISFWTAWWRAVPFGAMYAISMFWWTTNSIYVVPELAKQFARFFGGKVRETSKGWFGSELVEVMNEDKKKGTHGHIAVGVNNVDRAKRYFEAQGYEFDEDSATYDEKGNMKFIYFKDEIGGFAIHLVL